MIATATSMLGLVRADPQPHPAPLPRLLTGSMTGSENSKAFSRFFPASGFTVLSDFKLEATGGGDREISTIGAFAYPRVVNGALRGNQGFPYTWRVAVHELRGLDGPEYRKDRVEATCQNECRVPIPRRRPGFQFLLTGFKLDRPERHANVRRMAVVPYPDQGYVHVRFQDNSSRKFQASVYYTYLPDRVVKVPRREARFSYRPGGPAPSALIGSEAYALVGFDFEFENGEHKLKKFGIVFDRPNLVPHFSDQNTDDPWHATVMYAALNH
jgi:hypothetical protein